MEFKYTSGKGLVLVRGATQISVDVQLCFPLKQRHKYFSVRDGENQEVAFVEDLGSLDMSSRRAFEAALEAARFHFRVEGIISITESLECRHWVVRTQAGLRKFQTKLSEFPFELDQGYLVTDLFGDQYVLPDVRQMDVESQQQLWPLV